LTIYTIDPFSDARWPEFLERSSDASVFHSTGWMEALRRTYGYTTTVYTTTPPNRDLDDGVPFSMISSMLTGKRLVSVPFADHCQPLFSSKDASREILDEVTQGARKIGCRYVELRPIVRQVGSDAPSPDFGVSEDFAFHEVDLTPDIEQIYSGFHKTAVKQMIGRAERDEVRCEVGTGEDVLIPFYSLMIKTRRKHQLPPQPISWFRNLIACIPGGVTIRVAFKDTVPIAATLTLSFKSIDCHKYSCSDPAFTSLGGTALLMWKAIQDGKTRGATVYDLGRSDRSNDGLVKFKERWGGSASSVVYYRNPIPASNSSGGGLQERLGGLLARLPDAALVRVGSILYRHMG